jgi:hypothetical protein
MVTPATALAVIASIDPSGWLLIGVLLLAPALMALFALWFWLRGRRTWHYFALNLGAAAITYTVLFSGVARPVNVGLCLLLGLSTFLPPFVFRNLWARRAVGADKSRETDG